MAFLNVECIKVCSTGLGTISCFLLSTEHRCYSNGARPKIGSQKSKTWRFHGWHCQLPVQSSCLFYRKLRLPEPEEAQAEVRKTTARKNILLCLLLTDCDLTFYLLAGFVEVFFDWLLDLVPCWLDSGGRKYKRPKCHQKPKKPFVLKHPKMKSSSTL